MKSNISKQHKIWTTFDRKVRIVLYRNDYAREFFGTYMYETIASLHDFSNIPCLV